MKEKHRPKLEEIKCGVSLETGLKPSVFARILGSELLMDAASCVPLAAGLLAAMLAATELDGSLVTCLSVCAASVVIVCLLSRRWWLSPCAAIALTAVWLASRVLAGDLTGGISYLRGFARWIITGAPYIHVATESGYTTLIFYIAALAITALIFAMIRRLFYFPVFASLQVSAVILVAIFTRADLSATVCLSAAGLILLLPRVYAKHIEKLGSPSFEKQGGADSVKIGNAKLSRAGMQAAAVPVAALAILFSMWITPADTATWKSNMLSNWMEDISTLFRGRYNEFPGTGARFSLASAGYGTETGRLGGPVALSDELFLMVRSPRPVLLKGAVFDYYSGEGWSASRQDGTLRFDSILWRGDRKDAFDLDKPVGTATAKALYKQLTEEISISVVHEKAALGALFTTGYVYGISLGKQLDGSNAYFNRRSDVFIKTYAPRKAEYTIRSLVWNTKVDGFDELFEQLEEQTSDKKRYAEVSERYTQLPENLPDKVRRTASDVTGGIISPYMKAKAISRWLAENNAYTLQPETPPEGVDFTAFFLESGKGYCVYYATAMAVLARCCGLPARYVQGFALTDSPWGGDYQYQATGLTAHAWSEVYFEGIGWVAFDPLSWDAGAPLGDNVGEGNLQMTMPPPAPPTPPPERPGGKPALAEPLDGLGGRAALALLIIGLFTPVLYGLYRWALWAGPRRITRVWELGAVRQHVAEPSKQLDAFYNDTLKLLALQELTVLPDETLGTFPKRIDRIVVLGDAKLADIAVAMMASHFGNIPPSDCDLERACLYHSLLESMTLETLGKRKYLIKRVLPWYFRRMQ